MMYINNYRNQQEGIMPTMRTFFPFSFKVTAASAIFLFMYGFIAVPGGVVLSAVMVLTLSISFLGLYPKSIASRDVTLVMAVMGAETVLLALHAIWFAYTEHHNVIFIAITALMLSFFISCLCAYKVWRWPEPFDPRSNAWAFQDHFGGRTPPKSD